MKTLKISGSRLFPIVAAGMVLSCTTMPPKSEELIAAEQFYQITLQNPKVSQHAVSELNKANITLIAAAKAKTTGQMAALAYVGNNQINSAIVAAEINASVKRIREIRTIISNLPKLYDYDDQEINDSIDWESSQMMNLQ
jgi:hypothetical protein